ncbi:hypothetical protein [Paenibacillus sp. RC67]|uniref:hypothetical protein n=1 Tax=Paenibacillus sp. RC67 TaxID=3039392 RepID=UPI0024AE123F|nr:hypothetical protein [Paenibacillus sp. RC67]
MPNYYVFDQTTNPLYIEQVNPYTFPGVDGSPEGSASMAGSLYIANFSSSITSAQNLILQVTNPVGSGKTMYVSRVYGSSSIAGATATLQKNGTVTGSAVTPLNLNFGSSNTSVMTARGAAGTVTGSPVSFLMLILPSGPFSLSFTGSIIVPTGNSLTISVGLGAATASAVVSWWEY